MKMYEVKAKCGHVGRNYYALKSFAIEAEDGKEAAKIVRNKPRVKHHHKDAIKSVNEIDEKRFREIILANRTDPYFRCHNVQEQREYEDPDIYPEDRYYIEKENEANIKTVRMGKMVIKKPKKYIRNYYFAEGWAY